MNKYYQHQKVIRLYSPEQLQALCPICRDEYLPNASLKISRRVVIYRHFEQSRSERNHSQIKKSTYSKLSMKLFNHWNSLGQPFIRHRNLQSKTVTNGLDKVEKSLKKYSWHEVRNAMTLANEAFKSDWFAFNLKYGRKKISLSAFFEYGKWELNNDPIAIKANVKSWFKQFIKGEEYVRKKFPSGDKDPDLTQWFADEWKSYSEEEPDGRDMQAFRKATKLIYKYCDKNPEYAGIGHIQGSIEKIFARWKQSKDFTPSASYIGTKKFWNREITKQLVRENVISHSGWIKTI